MSLAQGFIARGNLSITEMNRNIQRLREIGYFHGRPEYLQDAFKIGLCQVSSTGDCKSNSLLGLSNSTGIRKLFTTMNTRFCTLYKRKAHIHHYTEFMEQSCFDVAAENLQNLIHQYSDDTFTDSITSSWTQQVIQGIVSPKLVACCFFRFIQVNLSLRGICISLSPSL